MRRHTSLTRAILKTWNNDQSHPWNQTRRDADFICGRKNGIYDIKEFFKLITASTHRVHIRSQVALGATEHSNCISVSTWRCSVSSVWIRAGKNFPDSLFLISLIGLRLNFKLWLPLWMLARLYQRNDLGASHVFLIIIRLAARIAKNPTTGLFFLDNQYI